jgi:hypothetical protein
MFVNLIFHPVTNSTTDNQLHHQISQTAGSAMSGKRGPIFVAYEICSVSGLKDDYDPSAPVEHRSYAAETFRNDQSHEITSGWRYAISVPCLISLVSRVINGGLSPLSSDGHDPGCRLHQCALVAPTVCNPQHDDVPITCQCKVKLIVYLVYKPPNG